MDTDLVDDVGLGALALLRTAGWMYGLLVVVAAATAPLGAPALAAALLLPLTPLVLTLVARGLLTSRGRALRVVPFAATGAAAGLLLLGARAALAPGAAADLAVAGLAVGISGLAISALAD